MTPGGPASCDEIIVRAASPEDIPFVVECVQALVRELSGTPDRLLPSSARDAAAQLVGEKDSGIALVAFLGDTQDQPIGLITASRQSAIRTGGDYAIVQELYVLPQGRGRGVGGVLIRSLLEQLRSMDVAVVEVGLPDLGFSDEPRTRAFYAAHGFRTLGYRMRGQS